MSFALSVLRTVLWPLIYPFLKEAFENYIKDHERAVKIDEATFASIQARTAREKLDASRKMFNALKR
jgi:hypothetical protein